MVGAVSSGQIAEYIGRKGVILRRHIRVLFIFYYFFAKYWFVLAFLFLKKKIVKRNNRDCSRCLQQRRLIFFYSVAKSLWNVWTLHISWFSLTLNFFFLKKWNKNNASRPIPIVCTENKINIRTSWTNNCFKHIFSFRVMTIKTCNSVYYKLVIIDCISSVVYVIDSGRYLCHGVIAWIQLCCHWNWVCSRWWLRRSPTS